MFVAPRRLSARMWTEGCSCGLGRSYESLPQEFCDADNGYVRRDDTTAATCALLPEHVTGRDVGGERQLGLWSKRRFRCIQGVRHVPRTENALDTCPSSGPFNESVPKKLVMLSKTSPAACAAAMSRFFVSTPADKVSSKPTIRG